MPSFMSSPTSRARARTCLGAFAATLVIGFGTLPVLAARTVPAPPITVDGAAVSVPALERNKQVFVPVRGVFEKLGAVVTYTAPISIVARKSGRDLARLSVGSRSAIVRGLPFRLAVAPFGAHGHVMVPLRVISEAAGATVAYVASPRAVRITQRTVAAAAPVTAAVAEPVPAAPVAEERHGIPWWVWILAALVLLGILLALLRRKKEPIIATSGAGRSEPVIKTRR